MRPGDVPTGGTIRPVIPGPAGRAGRAPSVGTVGLVQTSRAIAIGGVAVLVIGAAIVVGVSLLNSSESGPECHVPASGTAAAAGAAGLDLDAVQLQHASTINAVGLERGLPERARIIALATAWQESTMRNLDYGDRDSVGLFQQRTSQGWGSVAEIMDPVYASGKFYDALEQVPDWQDLPLTEAAQAVQYSGFPDAYAKWEDDATVLATDLGGDVDPQGSCRAGAQTVTAEQPDRAPVTDTAGATAALDTVLGALQAELGGVKVISIDDDGTGAVLTTTVDGLSAAESARAAAAWAVAHATTMDITTVAADGRTWSDHQWRDGADGVVPGQVRVIVGS